MLKINTMFTKEEIQRLPKWAQRRVEAMISNAESQDRKLREQDEKGDSNVFISLGMDKRNLPVNSRIGFKIKDAEIQVRHHGEELEIYSSFNEERLCIMPSVSNVIFVGFKKDR